MSEGRPDFDVGDLVVALGDGRSVRKGSVYLVAGLFFLPEATNEAGRDVGSLWVVQLSGQHYLPGHGHPARFYRRIEPRPPEFFSGVTDVQARAPEQVPA